MNLCVRLTSKAKGKLFCERVVKTYLAALNKFSVKENLMNSMINLTNNILNYNFDFYRLS